ncbi:hypothetical protein Droror1_Dr00008407 [Drosera rotundifolia]
MKKYVLVPILCWCVSEIPNFQSCLLYFCLSFLFFPSARAEVESLLSICIKALYQHVCHNGRRGHWSLLILCHFNEYLNSTARKPCMILLDSLQMADPRQLEPKIIEHGNHCHQSVTSMAFLA